MAFVATPLCCNHDAYSIAFVFLPAIDDTAVPCIRYGQGETHRLAPVVLEQNRPVTVYFGPLVYQEPPEAEIFLCRQGKKIFRKKIRLYDPMIFNRNKINLPYTWTMYMASCFRLPTDYAGTPISLAAYQKFETEFASRPSDMLVSLGDTVYLQESQTASRFGLQNRYAQFLNFPYLRQAVSDSRVVGGIDDHDLGINDTLGSSYNIGLARQIQQEILPAASYPIANTICSLFNVGDLTYIQVDDVSHRVLDIETGLYSSILGQEQLRWFCNALSNASVLYGERAMIFVIDGKSWFGTYGGQTYPFCPSELDVILHTIKTLGLKNVIHLCGDSHFSDASFYPTTDGNGITELRNSAIGSNPRKNINDNPYRIPGSLVDVNNFGRLVVSGSRGAHSLLYEVITADGIAWSWTKNQ
ncbi:hypothetical protein EBZ80_05460 [bacterium]|nr:hypothetical protein [bacterium]